MEYRYFQLKDFACKHTGKNEIKESFVLRLDEAREKAGIPFVITSGYRDKSHPVEARKRKGGMHTKGIAADILANDGVTKRKIVAVALEMGFGGIGVGKNFIHLDDRETTPVIWGY